MSVKVYSLNLINQRLPLWVNEKKRRALKKDKETKAKVQLINDFEMPDLSTCVKMSSDGRYILATGTYKPKVKCFDALNLSLKFERGLEGECHKMEIISEDYSLLAFLQDERYLEIHNKQGRLERVRYPIIGRDMWWHSQTAEILCCGNGTDIHRLSLNSGRFMHPYKSSYDDLTCMAASAQPEFGEIMVGNSDGIVELFDYRDQKCVRTLDCVTPLKGVENLTSLPYISAISYSHSSMHFSVGTSCGQLLIFDVRSKHPLIVKDHCTNHPILKTKFHKDQIFSLDKSNVFIFNTLDGSLYTQVRPSESNLNDLCVVQDSGLFFVAQDDKKILTHYIPSLGVAPKWASYLDNMIQQLQQDQETDLGQVSEGLKFVTKEDLEEVNLGNLIGTNYVTGQGHGYLVNTSMYNQSKKALNYLSQEERIKKIIREDYDALVEKLETKYVNPKVVIDEERKRDMFMGLDELEEEKAPLVGSGNVLLHQQESDAVPKSELKEKNAKKKKKTLPYFKNK